MWAQTGCEAIRAKRRVELRYNGFSRIVEVHAVGVSTAGEGLARVWQVRGGSESGERVGWKLMRLDEAIGAGLIDEPSQAPRPGYNRGDRAMRMITCQV